MQKLVFLITLTLSTLCYGQQEFQTISGCAMEDYVEADMMSSIAFSGRSYTPKCLKVLVGSEVTISASKNHPLLSQGKNPLNPIFETESTQAFMFNDTGFFGYFCDRHGNAQGEGMAGSIWVVEAF